MSWLKIASAILISLGSIASFIPQFHKIISNGSVDGISQISLVLTNIGMFCLTMNSLIFTWTSLKSHQWLNILPFIQISISWVMVLVYYVIFLVYKFNSRKAKKRCIHGLHYLTTYVLFVVLVITLIIAEHASKKNQSNFFRVFAEGLGYSSAIINSVVYVPQILELYQKKRVGSNSFLMYFMQTPGNVIIIIFQAVIFHGHISTWITYALVFVEQVIVLALMSYYHYYPRKLVFPVNSDSFHSDSLEEWRIFADKLEA